MEQEKKIGRKLDNNELSYFCGQMALILKSGISALEGIDMMKDDNSSEEDKAILDNIKNDMIQNGSLFQSMENTGLFPIYMLHMVRIGEQTGNLDEVMHSLQEHYEREESIRVSIQNALIYPFIMAGMIIVVILILLVCVMPIFNQVFKQLGTEMTGFAAGLLNIGTVIGRYSMVLILILAVLLVLAFLGARTEKGRRIGSAFLNKFPFFRSLNSRINACHFAGGMAITLRSGISPDQCFEMVSELSEDPDFKKQLEACNEKMMSGLTMADALKEVGIFGGVYSRMTSIGNKTGALDQVMSQISDLYQEDIDNKINNRLAVLEPALIIVLSIIVGIILLSVMFPLLGIMASL